MARDLLVEKKRRAVVLAALVILALGATVAMANAPELRLFQSSPPPVPTVTFTPDRPADNNGWYNHQVVFAVTGSDGLGGTVTCAPSSITYDGPDTETAAVSATCTDARGNSTTGSYSFKFDKTAPAISILAPSATTYALYQVVNANYSCAGGPSGSGACDGPVANGSPIDTASVGSETFMVSATDGAGNPGSKSVTYSIGYKVCALFDQTKSHNSGSTVPLKLQLCDINGVNYSASNITVTATSTSKVDSSASPTVVEDSGNANPDQNFRYDATLGTTGGYIYNLQTKGFGSGTWKVTFNVGGATSTSYFVNFDIK